MTRPNVSTSQILLTLLFGASIIFLSGCGKKATVSASPTPLPTNLPWATPAMTPERLASLSAHPADQLKILCRKGQTPYQAIFSTGHHASASATAKGKIVTNLDGTAQGNGKVWTFTINNKKFSKVVDAYHCKGGEVIAWQLQ